MKVILFFLLLFRFVDYHFWLSFFAFGLSPRVFVSPAADLFDNVAFAESFAMKQIGSSVIDHFHCVSWKFYFL